MPRIPSYLETETRKANMDIFKRKNMIIILKANNGAKNLEIHKL